MFTDVCAIRYSCMPSDYRAKSQMTVLENVFEMVKEKQKELRKLRGQIERILNTSQEKVGLPKIWV